MLTSPIKRNSPARTSGLKCSPPQKLEWRSVGQLDRVRGIPSHPILRVGPGPLATSHFVILPKAEGKSLDCFLFPQGPFEKLVLYSRSRRGKDHLSAARTQSLTQLNHDHSFMFLQLHERLWLAPPQTLFRFCSLYHEVRNGTLRLNFKRQGLGDYLTYWLSNAQIDSVSNSQQKRPFLFSLLHFFNSEERKRHNDYGCRIVSHPTSALRGLSTHARISA
jgi:hypothetical protein